MSLGPLLPPPVGQPDQARAEEQQRCRFGDSRCKCELPADFAIRVLLCMDVDVEATGFGMAHEVHDVLVRVGTGNTPPSIGITVWGAYVQDVIDESRCVTTRKRPDKAVYGVRPGV